MFDCGEVDYTEGFLYKEADFGVTHAYAVMHNDGTEFARYASVQNI